MPSLSSVIEEMLSLITGSRAAGVLAVGLCLPAGGCFLLPLGGRPTAGPGGALSPVGQGLRDFRVAFHCHSHLSHDSEVPFEEILETAKRLGFNAVILNDHYQPGNIARSPRGVQDGVLFIPGVEMRPDPLPGDGPVPGKSKKRRGSLLAFGMPEDFDQDRPREPLARALADAGALIAAGHCEDFTAWDRYPLSAFEVYNLHTQFERASRWGIFWRALFFLPDPFFESRIDPAREVFRSWDARLAEGKRLAPLAGHDAHSNIRFLGITLGTYPELLRLFSNHVLAPDLEAGPVLEGIRRGRVYVSFDFLGDASGFALTYGGNGSAPPALLGDEAPHRADSLLEVALPAAGTIRVLRDGAPWREARGRTFAAPVPGPGVYRVEVDRADRGGRDRLWIVSAPIYVRPGEG